VEVGEEVIGEGGPDGEIVDQREDPLAGSVNFDFGADRTHRGAILVVRPRWESSAGRDRTADFE
jgi:hypothetical protein